MWEYLSVRFNFKGRGVTQEFNLLDSGGERLEQWASERGSAAETLPELLVLAGEDGWELATHTVHESQLSGETWHYMHFKRPKDSGVTLR